MTDGLQILYQDSKKETAEHDSHDLRDCRTIVYTA